MRLKIKKILFTGCLFLAMSCATVPLTGRRQLSLVPDSQMLSMSYQAYNQFKQENSGALSPDAQATAMVKNVGSRIQRAVEAYMAENDMADQLEGFQWEFNLVQNDEPNAWAMPGGKTMIYTGILSLTKNETGLAVVMGHEVAHALARHGNERMSQALAQQMGGMALSVAMSSRPQETQNMFLNLYGVGSQVGLLRYSRQQESEADHMGLIFMAKAGYNPQESVPFWQRMAQISQGQQRPPEFLSTHPASSTRVRNLERLMPEAMRHYQQARR
jgi:predicted Zn-dependent protease